MIPSSDYEIDTKLGRIRSSNSGSLGSDEHTLSFQYYPIFFNPYIQQSIWNDPLKLPYITERGDTDIFDGLSIVFDNDWFITSDDPTTSGNLQYNGTKSTNEYTNYMTVGHPERSQAEIVGTGNANQFNDPRTGSNPGGTSQGIGFGPYTLQPIEVWTTLYIFLSDIRSASTMSTWSRY